MALKLGKLSGRDFAWGQRVRRWLHSLYLLFIRLSVLGLTLNVKDIGRQTLIRGLSLFMDVMLTRLEFKKGMSSVAEITLKRWD